MDANDQEKVCKSGFVIIRADDTNKPAKNAKRQNIQEVGKFLGMTLDQSIKGTFT